MNLSPNNRFKIYIPDPWTEVKSDSSFASRMVSDAIRKVVNSNVKLRIFYLPNYWNIVFSWSAKIIN